VNTLSELLSRSKQQKIELGLLYTPAEIAQQPATWQITHRLFNEKKTELKEYLQQAKNERWTIYLVGAGSSDYIGHSVAHLLRKRWNCEVCVVASTDLLTNREDLVIKDQKYLWISFSRSGDSPEGVSVLEQALTTFPNVKHLVVSCNRDGRMVEVAAHNPDCFAMVLDDAVNDRSLAMTSSFTNMVLFGMELAHLWDHQSFDDTLKHMTQAASYMLEEGASLAQQLAKQGYRRACFVGSGALAGTTRESALKILELTAGNIQTMN